MQHSLPKDSFNKRSGKHLGNEKQQGFVKLFHRSVLYPVVPIGSFQFNKFIDFMRSLNFNSLYMDPAKNPTKKQKHIHGNH